MTRDIESSVEHVTFVASVTEAPYLKTKPLHKSQKELETRPDGSVLFSIDVILNHELERDLLGYGEGIPPLVKGFRRNRQTKYPQKMFRLSAIY